MLLRRIRPTDPVGIRRRLIVRELVAELRPRLELQVHRQRQGLGSARTIAPLAADIAWMLDEHGTTLTDIVASVTGAATILAVTGDPGRFRCAAAFASFAGTAPIGASAGDTIPLPAQPLTRCCTPRPRRRRGCRTRSRLPQRRLGDGNANIEAIRALSRHITTAVYRTLQAALPPAQPAVPGVERTHEAEIGRVEVTGNRRAIVTRPTRKTYPHTPPPRTASRHRADSPCPRTGDREITPCGERLLMVVWLTSGCGTSSEADMVTGSLVTATHRHGLFYMTSCSLVEPWSH